MILIAVIQPLHPSMMLNPVQEMGLLAVGHHMALPASEWMVATLEQCTMQQRRHARLL